MMPDKSTRSTVYAKKSTEVSGKNRLLETVKPLTLQDRTEDKAEEINQKAVGVSPVLGDDEHVANPFGDSYTPWRSNKKP